MLLTRISSFDGNKEIGKGRCRQGNHNKFLRESELHVRCQRKFLPLAAAVFAEYTRRQKTKFYQH